MVDFITYLLLLFGQPPQEPINTNNPAEVSTRGGGIPIQPSNQPETRQ